MTDDTYNGWVNRETWAIALHINNEPAMQEAALFEAEYLLPDTDYANTGEVGLGKLEQIGEAIVENLQETLKELMSFNQEATWNIINDIGSFWRIDLVELGEAFAQDALEARASIL